MICRIIVMLNTDSLGFVNRAYNCSAGYVLCIKAKEFYSVILFKLLARVFCTLLYINLL